MNLEEVTFKDDNSDHPMVRTLPTDFVPLDFQMDPETDDLIRGSRLRNGMVVLVESLTSREDPSSHIAHEMNDELECESYRCTRVLESSRWCVVTELLRSDHGYGGLTSFIALYADGTKRLRTYNESYAWFVRLDTM